MGPRILAYVMLAAPIVLAIFAILWAYMMWRDNNRFKRRMKIEELKGDLAGGKITYFKFKERVEEIQADMKKWWR